MSKPRVLIVATRYDLGTYYTHQWATDLQAQLALMDCTCLILNPTDMCRSGSLLTEAIDCVEYVVFYGHGQQDEWTALPEDSTGKTTPLVTAANVAILDGRRTFAGCCHSLAQLGPAYHKAFPNGAYVGYNDVFSFHASNHHYFGDIVNNGVIAFVKGASRTAVAALLQKAWAGLRDSFAGGGILQHRPDAFDASWIADDNGKRVGTVP
jgi:hypothetical protein